MVTKEWRSVAALNPCGLAQVTYDGRQRLLGPIKELRVQPDGRVFIVPKWLCEELHDRYGRLLGHWRVPNRVIEFDEDEVGCEAKTVSGVQVVEFHGMIIGLLSGKMINGVIEVEPSDRLDSANVVDLRLDEEGCEPAPWWFKVPGLVSVDDVRLEQKFTDERGVVVNDMPMTWVDMLMQGVKAYIQPDEWPEGYGDQCNEEFQIRFELTIEPHLVADSPGNTNMMPDTVTTALRDMAESWGGVTVEWTGWVDKPAGGGYGIHTVTLSRLLNSFADQRRMEKRRLLSFLNPKDLGAAEEKWTGNLRALGLYLEGQIRQHFDQTAVEAHLTHRGVVMPLL